MTNAMGSTQSHADVVAHSSFAPSFDEVYEQFLPYVWTTLRRFGVPEMHREDLAHDVFVVVHERLAGIDTTRPLKPWLCGVCFRVASDFRRRAQHRYEQAGDDIDVAQSNDANSDEHLLAKERRAQIERAIAAVDFDRRAVFVLYEIDEVPMNDIARALDIPLNTAYSRLRMAREDFKGAYERLVRKEARDGA